MKHNLTICSLSEEHYRMVVTDVHTGISLHLIANTLHQAKLKCTEKLNADDFKDGIAKIYKYIPGKHDQQIAFKIKGRKWITLKDVRYV